MSKLTHSTDHGMYAVEVANMKDGCPHTSAGEFMRIAQAIADDPEWFQDKTIDDVVLIEALHLAADARRAQP